MEVSNFIAKFEQEETSAFKNFEAIYRNLLEYKLNNSSDKRMFLKELENIKLLSEAKDKLKELESFFLNNKHHGNFLEYHNKDGIIKKADIGRASKGVFRFFRKKSLELYYDFLRELIKDTPEASIKKKHRKLKNLYSTCAIYFSCPPEINNSNEVLNYYWIYAFWRLEGAYEKNFKNDDIKKNNILEDDNIKKDFFKRISFQIFNKKCVEIVKKVSVSFAVEYRGYLNFIENPNTGISSKLSMPNEFMVIFNELKKNDRFALSNKNILFEDLLANIGIENKDITQIGKTPESKLSKASESLICGISFDSLVDPVLTPYGHTYSKNSIETWLGLGRNTDPSNKQFLSIYLLHENTAILALQLFLNSIQPAKESLDKKTNRI